MYSLKVEGTDVTSRHMHMEKIENELFRRNVRTVLFVMMKGTSVECE